MIAGQHASGTTTDCDDPVLRALFEAHGEPVLDPRVERDQLIGQLRRGGWTAMAIVEFTGISRAQIYRILAREARRAG
jgi:hypothetical protein